MSCAAGLEPCIQQGIEVVSTSWSDTENGDALSFQALPTGSLSFRRGRGTEARLVTRETAAILDASGCQVAVQPLLIGTGYIDLAPSKQKSYGALSGKPAMRVGRGDPT